METLLGTVESAAGARLTALGLQLALLGGVALFLGGIRLYAAERRFGRRVLVVGLGFFALGGGLRSMEGLGLLQLDYYPGWRTDFEDVLLEDHADMEFSEDDLEAGDPTPAWWEGLVWWTQRLGLVLGAGLGAVGLVADARFVLREGRPRSRPNRTSKAR